ncbi:MAG: class I SAM-dependent rRNA methyltransferase [Candidatus Calescibacterium sp.]|nr:class I SAM-dependent rRNA methyltransferase [Candidatus Calescibacterium sp.]MCX7972740.1 class I SAM-dependent rRNA methyltransferase [bacterium]MDW8195544.1 class I SAM-dependent rRNA methyltransferase [Candidatus Calescibacterium sp.]
MIISIDRNIYEKVKTGYLWIFANEIKKHDINDGDIVDLHYNNQFVCKAYYNSKSKISYRVISFLNKPIDLEFWFEKLSDLYNQKSRFYQGNFRWVYSEGDLLPGLIIDLFTTDQGKKVAVCMLLTLGIEKQKENIFQALRKMKIDCIIDRSDSNLRKLEGLELRRKIEYGTIEIPFIVNIDGIDFLIDPLNGQKTGFYFDQTENRRFLKNISKGCIVLDVFSYIGTFSLYALKYGAKFVEMIDESSFASEIVPKIMKLNNFQDRYIFYKDDAFSKLRELNYLGKRFSIVIVDPPSFTKTKEKVKNALKAYFDINNNALKLVTDGGYFITSSCSQKIKENDLLEVLRDVFHKQKCMAKLIYRGNQAFDHPINLSMEETNYLKFFVFQVYRNE